MDLAARAAMQDVQSTETATDGRVGPADMCASGRPHQLAARGDDRRFGGQAHLLQDAGEAEVGGDGYDSGREEDQDDGDDANAPG